LEKKICFGCDKEVNILYHVSKKVGFQCEECSKNNIRRLKDLGKWYEIDLKALFEIDGEFVDEVLDLECIYYCQKCGYFDFKKFNKCPCCLAEDLYVRSWYLYSEKEYLEELLTSTYMYIGADYNGLSFSIAKAKYFINVATYTIDKVFLGQLEVKSQQGVDVHIVVGRVDDELRKYLKASEKLSEIVRYDPESHVKLVVIDGVLAFKGSANLTLDGWQRLKELREVTTIPEEVKELNNDYIPHSYELGKRLK